LFRNFLKLDLLLATASDVRSFLAHLKRERNYGAKTLLRKQACLRSFYKFCKKNKKISENPVEDIEAPKIPKRQVVYLTEQERHLLFETARQKTYSVKGKRNYAILLLLYYTGLRVHELIGLNKQSFIDDGFTFSVKVIGKGNKERVIPIHQEAKNVLDIWLQNRPKSLSNAIFTNPNGERLSISMVQKMIQKLTKQAGIEKQITPHKLRHTFGTDLLLKGANLVNIQYSFRSC
jgi:integrase/recombinase XerD